MESLKPPILEESNGFIIVREDLIPGGTKARAIPVLFDGADEYVYASPVYGYAQIALACAAATAGKKATIFCARRAKRHALTIKAISLGANVVEVEVGYLTVVQSRAKSYCQSTAAKLLPFGLDHPLFIGELARIASGLPITPREVWCAAGSGVLARALQLAWPLAQINAVQVGKVPDVGRARLFVAPEKFEKDAQIPPPFASCSNYDAKVWRFMKQHGTPGALFWNL